MIRIFLITIFSLIIHSIFGQSKLFFPNLELETKKNRIISSRNFKQSNHIKIIVFWTTNNRSSIQELNALELKNKAWKNIYDTQIISISLDSHKQKNKVIPFIESNGWTFNCYLDPTAKSMISIKGENVPLTLILNEIGEVIWSIEGFDSNTIAKIEKELNKLTN